MMKCKHCGVEVTETNVGGYWTHITRLARCQSKDVAYGHLAEPEGMPCRADGPNPCLGAFAS